MIDYTHFYFRARVQAEAAAGLLVLAGKAGTTTAPRHRLFTNPFWYKLWEGTGPGHERISKSGYYRDIVTIDCLIRNHHGTIHDFLHWISPYIEAEEGANLGFIKYEYEDKEPIMFRAGKAEVLENIF